MCEYIKGNYIDYIETVVKIYIKVCRRGIMPKTTSVVQVELDKKLFQREKSKRQGYDYKGYKAEFVCRVGYVDIGAQTEKKTGKGKIVLSSGFGEYAQKFKFADEAEATAVAIQLLVMTGHATLPKAYAKKAKA